MKNFFGLIIVLLGVGFLLQQLKVPGADTIMRSWWPLVIIAVGLLAWMNNQRRWFGPLIIVLVGLALMFDQLNIWDRSAWNVFWPMIIIAFGARLVFGRGSGQVMSAEKTDQADIDVVFSGAEKRVTGEFKEASVSAWFGGIKLDLRQAQFTESPILHVTAGFGGVDILVPPQVNVVTKVAPIFGGVDDKSDHAHTDKTLRIEGTAMFSGVSVKN